MLTVTNSALDRLSRRLVRKQAADGVALRFTRRECGWRLCMDEAVAGDTSIDHEGRTVLLLDKDVSKTVANMTLDIARSGRRSRYRLSRTKPARG